MVPIVSVNALRSRQDNCPESVSRQRRDVGRGLRGRRALAEPPDDAVFVHLPRACRSTGVNTSGNQTSAGSALERGAALGETRTRRASRRPSCNGGDRWRSVDPIAERPAKWRVAQTVADDRDVRLGLILVRQERAALGRAHPEHVEERRGDLGSVDLFRLSAPGELAADTCDTRRDSRTTAGTAAGRDSRQATRRNARRLIPGSPRRRA